MCQKAGKLSQIQDAFNPSPLITAEELREFYFDTSLARTGDRYSDVVNNLSLQLSNSVEVVQHKLFIGHPGCGKTTELCQLMQKTTEMGFVTCFGRCDLELDSADVEYTDVLFMILDLLVRTAKDNSMELDEDLVVNICDYWQQDVDIIDEYKKVRELSMTAEAGGKIGISGLLRVLAQVKGVIKNSSDSRIQIRRHIEPKSSELIGGISDVILSISDQCEKMGKKRIPLIILDGLDKIPLEKARKIFWENGSRFSALRVHLIVTFPIALAYTPEYSDVLTWFPNPEKLPMIKLRKWTGEAYEPGYCEGIDTMRHIVEKRADLSLFQREALDELIEKTGGYIRDLFRCISRAAVRAQLRGSDTISAEDASAALNNLESDINGRYADSMISVMKKIYKGEKYVSSSEEITKLLQVGAVLEYNGQRWCDLHPLVEKWLKEHGKIK